MFHDNFAMSETVDLDQSILKFLNKKYSDSGRYVKGREIQQSLGNVDDSSLRDALQHLKDEGLIDKTNITGDLPLARITAKGRNRLKGYKENNSHGPTIIDRSVHITGPVTNSPLSTGEFHAPVSTTYSRAETVNPNDAEE